MIRVLFLCLGNICRSPMAEAVFRAMVQEQGLEHAIEVDSAGLGNWHVGERPHEGTQRILNDNNIPHEGICSRQIKRGEAANYDYLVAMDDANMAGLQDLGVLQGERVFKLLDLVVERKGENVPDPYFTGDFNEVYDLVTAGCRVLLERIKDEAL